MVAGLVLVGPLKEPDPTVAPPLKVEPPPPTSQLHDNFYFLPNNMFHVPYALSYARFPVECKKHCAKILHLRPLGGDYF